MKNEVVVTATSIKKAIDEAIEELGAKIEEVEYEVLEEPSKKIFGGSTNAKVRVYLASPSIKASDNQETEIVYNNKEEESPDENERLIIDDEDLNYNKASKQLTEEELDKIADTAIEAIRMILEYFGAEESDIDEYEGEEGELILDIMGDNLAVLIGRHGKTIDAIQFLVSSIVNKKTGFRHPLVVDVKGYKHKRKQKIVSVAKASAARAIRQKHELRLRPMTPYERRIVHVALRDDKRITTVSEGTEPNRYIIIKPK